MAYLSCRAESAIVTSNSHTKTTSKSNYKEEPENPIKIQQFEYSDLEEATNGFSDQKILGRGSHGCVYKGVLRSGRLVAIKKPSRGVSLRVASSADSTNELENEIDILSKIHSPRLVNLVGFTKNSRDRLLVVEFMSNGTLYDVLHSSSRPPNWGRRIRLALQIAKAIDTLHSSVPPVIHRDIKSANVLIDRNSNARLGDFGLALQCHIDDYRFVSTPPAGTIGYLDPCYVTSDNLSTKTDVFSFGILLLEILSGRKAIDMGHSPPSIVDWAIPLIRKRKLLAIYDPRIPPPKDPSVRKHLAKLAAKCVRSCRDRRPSMKDVVESLSVLSKTVSLHTWNGFSVNNPCLIVDTVGRPIESGNTLLNLRPRRPDKGDGEVIDNRPPRISRNVYFDSGSGVEPNSEANWGSSFGVGSGTLVGRGRTKSLTHGYDWSSNFHLRRNQSVRGSLGTFSRRDRIARLDDWESSARAADAV